MVFPLCLIPFLPGVVQVNRIQIPCAPCKITCIKACAKPLYKCMEVNGVSLQHSDENTAAQIPLFSTTSVGASAGAPCVGASSPQQPLWLSDL